MRTRLVVLLAIVAGLQAPTLLRPTVWVALTVIIIAAMAVPIIVVRITEF